MDNRHPGAEEAKEVPGASRSRNITVAIRFRPLLKAERAQSNALSWVAGDPRPNCIRDLRSSQALEFDHVFKSSTSTPQLFEACVADIVLSHCEGYNGAIFAYGQTASGKTLTMYGDGERPGVIQLAVEKIFNYIANHPDRSFMMELAYLEIYNEQVFDLRARSSNSRDEVQVLEDENGESVFKGLSWLRVSRPEDIQKCLEKCVQHRHVDAAEMVERSSGSHTILRIKLESIQQDCSKTVFSSMLDLVDLAGSEGLRNTEATVERRREGTNTDKSLLALSQVIRSLSDKSRCSSSHISFRESKLTRILRSSIGGNSQTVVICAVSPAASNYSATQSTLEFASRARSVCNKVHVSRVSKGDHAFERIRSMFAEVSKLEDRQTSRGEHADSSVAQAATLDGRQLGKGRRRVSSHAADQRRSSCNEDRSFGKSGRNREDDEKHIAEAARSRLLKKQEVEHELKKLRDAMAQARDEAERLERQQAELEELELRQGGRRGASAAGCPSEEAFDEERELTATDGRGHDARRAMPHAESEASQRGRCSRSPRRTGPSEARAPSPEEFSRPSLHVPPPRRAPLALPAPPEPSAESGSNELQPQKSKEALQLVQRLCDIVRPEGNVSATWSSSRLQMVFAQVHAVVDQAVSLKSSEAASSAAASVLEQRRGRPPATPQQNHRQGAGSSCGPEKASAAATDDMSSLYNEFQELSQIDKEYMEEKRHRAAQGQKLCEPAGRALPNTGVQLEAAGAARAAAAEAAASRHAEVSDACSKVPDEREKRTQRQGTMSPDSSKAFAVREAAKAEADNLQKQLAARRNSWAEGFGADERHLLKKRRMAPAHGKPRPSKAPELEADEALPAPPPPPATASRDAFMPIQDGCVYGDSSTRPISLQEPCRSPRRRLSGYFEKEFAKKPPDVDKAVAPRVSISSRLEASVLSEQTPQVPPITNGESETLNRQLRQQKEQMRQLQRIQTGVESNDLQIRLHEGPAAPDRAPDGKCPDQLLAALQANDPALEALIARRKSERAAGESRFAATQQEKRNMTGVTAQADRAGSLQKKFTSLTAAPPAAFSLQDKVVALTARAEAAEDIASSRSEALSFTQVSDAERKSQKMKDRVKELQGELFEAQRRQGEGFEATGGLQHRLQQQLAIPARAQPPIRQAQPPAAGGDRSDEDQGSCHQQ